MVYWAQINLPSPNGIMIGSAVYARLIQSDAQADHASVCSNRPHRCYAFITASAPSDSTGGGISGERGQRMFSALLSDIFVTTL